MFVAGKRVCDNRTPIDIFEIEINTFLILCDIIEYRTSHFYFFSRLSVLSNKISFKSKSEKVELPQVCFDSIMK